MFGMLQALPRWVFIDSLGGTEMGGGKRTGLVLPLAGYVRPGQSLQPGAQAY